MERSVRSKYELVIYVVDKIRACLQMNYRYRSSKLFRRELL